MTFCLQLSSQERRNESNSSLDFKSSSINRQTTPGSVHGSHEVRSAVSQTINEAQGAAPRRSTQVSEMLISFSNY